MRKLSKNVISIMMAISVLLGSIQPMYVSANNLTHVGHEECNHNSENVVIMGHSCNDYFDVSLKLDRVTIVGTSSMCKILTYCYEWRCTYPGCGIIEKHGYSDQYVSNHDYYVTSQGYNKCMYCGYTN